MEKSFKRLLSFAVALVMILGMIPVTQIEVKAAENQEQNAPETGTTLSESAVPEINVDNSNLNLVDGKAVCPVCAATGVNDQPVEWVAATAESKTYADGAHHHIYVPEGGLGTAATATSTGYLYAEKSGDDEATTVCIHLNGQTWNLNGQICAGQLATINVMGNGTVKGNYYNADNKNRAAVINVHSYRGTINLYGGTYIDVAGKANYAASVSSTTGGGQINMYKGVEIVGGVYLISRATGEGVSTFNMYGGTLRNGVEANGEPTYTHTYGGNVYVGTADAFNMYAGEIKNGIATDSGGNIYTTGGTVYLAKGTVVSNGRTTKTTSATSWTGGGNIFATGSGTVTCAATVENGYSSCWGGNCLINGANLILGEGASVSGGKAGNSGVTAGGNICKWNSGTLDIQKGVTVEGGKGGNGTTESNIHVNNSKKTAEVSTLRIAGDVLNSVSRISDIYVDTTITGTAKITNLELMSGAKFKAVDMEEGANVVVTPSMEGAFTEAIADGKAAEYAKYIHVNNAQRIYEVEGDYLVTGIQKKYCSHCEKEVLWRTFGSRTDFVTMDHGGHFLVTGDMTGSKKLAAQLTINYNNGGDKLYPNMEVVVDLNGHTVETKGRLALSYAKLYVLDSVGTGRVVGNYKDQVNGGVVMGSVNSQTFIHGGTWTLNEGCYGGSGGIFFISYGTLNIYDGATITGGVARGIYDETKKAFTHGQGGNIWLGAGGKLNMYGGTVSNGVADVVEHTVTEGETTTTTYGAGLGGNIGALDNTGPIKIYDGAQILDGAAAMGGNIYTGKGVNMTINGKVSGGEATAVGSYGGLGGNVYVLNGAGNADHSISIGETGEILNGNASIGGNIWSGHYTTVLGKVSGGTATQYAGNIYHLGTLNVGNAKGAAAEIFGGTAPTAGNIYSGWNLNVYKGAKIYGGTATSETGTSQASIVAGTTTFHGGVIGEAGDEGVALYANNSSNFIVNDVTLYGDISLAAPDKATVKHGVFTMDPTGLVQGDAQVVKQIDGMYGVHVPGEGTANPAPSCSAAGQTDWTCNYTYTVGEATYDCDGYSVAEGQLEHDWADATCTAPKTCKTCGETEGEANGHDWADATCTAAKTCKTCGETEGEANGHDWADATCTAPKTCGTCGATEGEAAGHDWADATCTAPKTCKTCGETEGEAKGHAWNDATCTAPKTCGTCGETEGEANGHDWADATCTAPKTCKTCGETEGEANGHAWNDATCTAPKTCGTCGATEGEAAGHKLTLIPEVPAQVNKPGAEAYYQCDVCAKKFSDAEGKTEIEAPKEIPALPEVTDDAKVGDTAYATLAEAVAAANANGGQVDLQKDVEVSVLVELATNVVLNLNGHKLTVKENGSVTAIYNDSAVIDTSEGREGRLVVEEGGKLYLPKENRQLPVDMGNGLMFVDVAVNHGKGSINGYQTWIDGMDEELAEALKTTGASKLGLKFQVVLTWGSNELTYTFGDDTVGEYAKNWKTYAMYLKVSGAEGLNLQYKFQIAYTGISTAKVAIDTANEIAH